MAIFPRVSGWLSRSLKASGGTVANMYKLGATLQLLKMQQEYPIDIVPTVSRGTAMDIRLYYQKAACDANGVLDVCNPVATNTLTPLQELRVNLSDFKTVRGRIVSVSLSDWKSLENFDVNTGAPTHTIITERVMRELQDSISELLKAIERKTVNDLLAVTGTDLAGVAAPTRVRFFTQVNNNNDRVFNPAFDNDFVTMQGASGVEYNPKYVMGVTAASSLKNVWSYGSNTDLFGVNRQNNSPALGEGMASYVLDNLVDPTSINAFRVHPKATRLLFWNPLLMGEGINLTTVAQIESQVETMVKNWDVVEKQPVHFVVNVPIEEGSNDSLPVIFEAVMTGCYSSEGDTRQVSLQPYVRTAFVRMPLADMLCDVPPTWTGVELLKDCLPQPLAACDPVVLPTPIAPVCFKSFNIDKTCPTIFAAGVPVNLNGVLPNTYHFERTFAVDMVIATQRDLCNLLNNIIDGKDAGVFAMNAAGNVIQYYPSGFGTTATVLATTAFVGDPAFTVDSGCLATPLTADVMLCV